MTNYYLQKFYMLIPIVDLSDNIIWYKERTDITTDDIYRVSVCRVVDAEWKILLSQRAFTKKHNPGKRWPAVAGTVEKDETYLSNILKEIHEEIGIQVTEKDIIVGKKDYTDKHRKHFGQRFLLTYTGPKEHIIPEEWAVEQLKRFTLDELHHKLAENRSDFVDSLEWVFQAFTTTPLQENNDHQPTIEV